MTEEPIPKESLSSKLTHYFDKTLGFITTYMRANPRKAAVGILILIGLLLLCRCAGD